MGQRHQPRTKGPWELGYKVSREQRGSLYSDVIRVEWFRVLIEIVLKDVCGCLPLTPKIRKFRVECKWKDWFCLPERKFSRENGISWKVDQISEWKMCVPFANFTSSRPFGLDRLWSYLPGKSRSNWTSASSWKFLLRIWRVPFTITVDQPVSPSKWYKTYLSGQSS